MKIFRRAFFFLSIVFAVAVRAGTMTGGRTDQSSSSSGTSHFPFEFETEFSLANDAEVARGFRQVRGMDEVYSMARFVYTPRLKFGILRLGAGWERFGFSMSQNFEVPTSLQSFTGIIGLDTQLSDSILVRFEAQPGFYGTSRFDGGSFHAPFILGGTYIYSSDLQFIFGVSVDYERSYPVFPGGGIRWRMGPQWVLNAAAPTPRLEYELNRNFTLYAGADLKGSTFRVDDRFGFERGTPRLNHAIITYSEVRTGAGFQWKLAPEVKFAVEGGYVPYRNFDFHRTDVRYHQESGGAYVSASLNTSF